MQAFEGLQAGKYYALFCIFSVSLLVLGGEWSKGETMELRRPLGSLRGCPGERPGDGLEVGGAEGSHLYLLPFLPAGPVWVSLRWPTPDLLVGEPGQVWESETGEDTGKIPSDFPGSQLQSSCVSLTVSAAKFPLPGWGKQTYGPLLKAIPANPRRP